MMATPCLPLNLLRNLAICLQIYSLKSTSKTYFKNILLLKNTCVKSKKKLKNKILKIYIKNILLDFFKKRENGKFWSNNIFS